MPITTLPAAPSRADPTNFATKADAFLGALAGFVTETNQTATAVNTDKTTSTQQATIATDKATIATTQAGLATTNGAAQVALATTQANLADADRVQTGQDRTATGISADAAEVSRIAASKLNLGNKTTAPTLDNQGAALLAGATYYDTTLAKWRVWSGSAWVEGISAVAGVSSVNGNNGAVIGIATTAANTFTGPQEMATGAVIASATTINLNTATGNRVHITGTTTINVVTLTSGPRTLIFDSVLTLTHNATNNNLPGAVNIITAANDRAIYESDGVTVYCVAYIPAGGLASRLTNTFTGAQIGTVTAITSTAAALAINLATNNNFSHTTTENTVLSAPSNPVAGQSGVITITQGAVARTLAYNTFWKFAGGTVPTLTATVGAVDILAYNVESATRATTQLIKDVK